MGVLWSRIIVIPDTEKEEKEIEVSKDESMKSEYLDNIQKRYNILIICFLFLFYRKNKKK